MLNKHIFLLTHFRSILYAIKSPCFKIFFCYRQNRNVHWETSLLLSLKFTLITVSNNLLQDFSSLNALRANLFHKRMRVEYSIFRFGWWNIFFLYLFFRSRASDTWWFIRRVNMFSCHSENSSAWFGPWKYAE